MAIDRILKKPVYLDRLKTEIQHLLTIEITKKYQRFEIKFFYFDF
jgi:hypothetical protein